MLERAKLYINDFALLIRHLGNLKAFAEGKHIHAHTIKKRYEGERYLGNLIVEMYGKCNALDNADIAWLNICKPNIFSWNMMISACIRCKDLDTARTFFDGIPHPDIVSWNALLTASAQLGTLTEAHIIFNRIPNLNAVSWTALIGVQNQNGLHNEALQLFERMKLAGIAPTNSTHVAILDVCTSLGSLAEGKKVHSEIIFDGVDSCIVIANALINMYEKSGNINDTHEIFVRMPRHDVVSWTAMINGYVHNGHGNLALQLFWQMREENMNPNRVTYMAVIDACASISALLEGVQIHELILHYGLELDTLVMNSLVNMYGRCGRLVDASAVFNKIMVCDVISWNTMIMVCCQNGHERKALRLFQEMRLEGKMPTHFTWVTIINACSCLSSTAKGKHVHALIVCNDFILQTAVGNALIDMYGKCRYLEEAHIIFGRMPKHDVISWTSMLTANVVNDNLEGAQFMFNSMAEPDLVSWTTMLTAYSQNGYSIKALQLFHQMEMADIILDEVVYAAALDACAVMAFSCEGKRIHNLIINNGVESHVLVGNALINMYGKCGHFEVAKLVFDKMPLHDKVSWNAMLIGYAQAGHANNTFKIFQQMQVEGMMPDNITILGILSACTYSGLIDKGCYYFVCAQDYEGVPTVEQSHCLVDLVGRTGQIDVAEDLVENMQCASIPSRLTTLLGASRVYKDLKCAQRAASHLFALKLHDSDDSGDN